MNIWLYAPIFIKGTLITILAWLISAAISFFVGTIAGISNSRYISSPGLSALIKVYIFIAKGVPAYIQILIAYFALPLIIGINISGFIAAIGALAFCSSGYTTEIVRSGINTIPTGQWDACFVLGYSRQKSLYRIILPQAFSNILPSLFGEFEQLLKSTSLLATIGITELTRTGMNIISRELNPIPVYLAIACIYLTLSFALQLICNFFEARAYGYR